ncbi:RNA ligase-domain-containing protein [Cristinia sonorae]|uniref:RNA ligase-domain-containing protein n=1 Tax=Cristinia sonorae TaxID=1940300 RepID=A0A8K0UIX8_9AGAR|nr:RNA ligase-domain-containing protein [Cristinia sonorae]
MMKVFWPRLCRRAEYLRTDSRWTFSSQPSRLSHPLRGFFTSFRNQKGPNANMASNSDLTELFRNISIDDTDSDLVHSLIRTSKASPKLVKSNEYAAPADPRITIRSWKMNEFKYYDIPSPFPTLARGLFTQEVKHGKHRIVARGYDKFFNIGEVPWNSSRGSFKISPNACGETRVCWRQATFLWAALEQHTSPPYTLTLKSNGCIIFIAALTPEKVLVTSKHSLGPSSGSGQDQTESHAQVGERWLRKHLADAGKTEAQLAKVLWDKNWTAVAELCDDSFEEHVLPYNQDKTGLHLHGLNSCTKAFNSQLQGVVDAFAREWGFIVTKSLVLNTIPEVKAFTEEIGRSGEWEGEALEGFVVRTHVSKNPPTKGNVKAHQSPYEPGSSFFFKVKFDEPYMMYRDWREVTKSLLNKRPNIQDIPKNKLRRPETRVYANWVIEEIKRDRKQFAEFGKGRGIIATRLRFQKWLETEEGRKAMAEATGKEQDGPVDVEKGAEGKTFGKTIIMPVAIPGSGKTSIAVALKYLFGFGHTQSDDVKAKKPAPVFLKNVQDLLKTHDVVIADKNNHLRQHRQQLRDATKNIKPPVRLMALNWSFDIPKASIHRICSERILARGENHQALRPDDTLTHERVLWMFLNDAKELTPDEVDVTVEMDIQEDLESALRRVVDACVETLGVPRPDAEKMGEAMAIIRQYKPSAPALPQKWQKPAAEPRYYALVPHFDVLGLVPRLIEAGGAPEGLKKFWGELVEGQRVGERTPHVTIVHAKGLAEAGNKKLWELCRTLTGQSNPPLFSFKLGEVVWDGRVMAVTVEDLAVDGDRREPSKEAVELVVKLPAELRPVLHITLGTSHQSILPFEAKALVQQWRNGARKGIQSVELKDEWIKGELKGLFN